MDIAKMKEDFVALKFQCQALGVGIVSPAETGCSPMGFKTDDVITLLDVKAKSFKQRQGLRSLQYVGENLMNYRGAGLMDYVGERVLEWIQGHPEYFRTLPADDYELLSRSGFVYLNKYGEEKDEEYTEYLKDECEGFEEAQRYKDGMEFFWMREF